MAATAAAPSSILPSRPTSARTRSPCTVTWNAWTTRIRRTPSTRPRGGCGANPRGGRAAACASSTARSTRTRTASPARLASRTGVKNWGLFPAQQVLGPTPTARKEASFRLVFVLVLFFSSEARRRLVDLVRWFPVEGKGQRVDWLTAYPKVLVGDATCDFVRNGAHTTPAACFVKGDLFRTV